LISAFTLHCLGKWCPEEASKRLAEEKSANDKSAVKEPESGAVEHQASKIIGNG
jgi:hypothetical protein